MKTNQLFESVIREASDAIEPPDHMTLRDLEDQISDLGLPGSFTHPEHGEYETQWVIDSVLCFSPRSGGGLNDATYIIRVVDSQVGDPRDPNVMGGLFWANDREIGSRCQKEEMSINGARLWGICCPDPDPDKEDFNGIVEDDWVTYHGGNFDSIGPYSELGVRGIC